MRELICPAFFITARLALFFVLTVWMIGQWFCIEMESTVFGDTFRVDTHTDSIGFAIYPDLDTRSKFRADPYGDGIVHGRFELFLDPSERLRMGWVDGPIPGVIVFLNYRGEPMGVVIHYFLIAMVFLVFNAILHWYYRKGRRKIKAPV